MAGPIAELFIKLGMDTSAVKGGADIAKQSMTGLGSTSSTIFKGISAGGAAAFGLMSVGASQMERAQGKFQSETGLSRAAAVAFTKDMNGLVGTAGTVGLSFDQITDAGTAVATQFQMTGKAGADMTESFAEFAKVTGQDATGAVNDFDDLLDAFHEPASRATSLMDQLVASHQKYGTEAGPEAIAALNKMAPALQGLNLGLDDGVGLLNAFEQNGLSADGAMRGLQTALKNIKPGQTFDDLIAQIGAIEDPTKRAQESMRIFGVKAGSALANAIQPGMTSLDNYKVSAQDAAGATAKAAGDMVTTTDKFRMFGEKLGAILRDAGSQFGPLVTAVASATTALGPVFAKGLSALAQTGPIKAASTYLGGVIGALQGNAQAAVATGVEAVEAMAARIGAMAIPLAPAGTTLGGAIGGAIALGIVTLGAVAIGAAILQAFNDSKHQIETDPQSINNVDLFQARAPMWARAKLAVAQQMQTLGTGALEAFNQTWNDGIAKGMDPNDPALLAAAKAAGEAIGSGTGTAAADELARHTASEHADYMAVGDDIASAVGDGIDSSSAATEGGHGFLNDFIASVMDYTDKARAAGEAQTAALVHGLATGIPDAHDVWKQFVKTMHDALDPAKEEAWLTGKLTSQKLQNGLASENPFVRQAAIDTRDALQKQLDDLHTLGQTDGADLGAGVVAGVDSKTSKVTAAASDYGDQVSRLKWSTWGQNVGQTYGEGIAAGINGVNFTGKINHLLDLVRGFSPPRAGPLRDIDRWGQNVGRAWAAGFEAGVVPDVSALDGLAARLNASSSRIAGGDGQPSSAGITIMPGGIPITVTGSSSPKETADAIGDRILEVFGRILTGSLTLPLDQSGRPA